MSARSAANRREDSGCPWSELLARRALPRLSWRASLSRGSVPERPSLPHWSSLSTRLSTRWTNQTPLRPLQDTEEVRTEYQRRTALEACRSLRVAWKVAA